MKPQPNQDTPHSTPASHEKGADSTDKAHRAPKDQSAAEELAAATKAGATGAPARLPARSDNPVTGAHVTR